MLPLDLAEGVSACSKSLSCQLIVSLNTDPSEIHHGPRIDRLPPTPLPPRTPRGSAAAEGILNVIE